MLTLNAGLSAISDQTALVRQVRAWDKIIFRLIVSVFQSFAIVIFRRFKLSQHFKFLSPRLFCRPDNTFSVGMGIVLTLCEGEM
jgi:hypothetical protein